MQNGRSDGKLASVNGTTRMRTAKELIGAFDTIGNRTQTEAGGDQTGANLRLARYTNNVLNQITSRDVPGDVDVMGLLLASNTVTVNSNTPYRRGEYFREQLAVTNTSAAVWTNITVASPGQSSVSGHVYVARTPETNTYDLDGNLLSDGRWTYSWDAENRLTNMTSLSGAPSGSQLNLSFVYDYMGRRIQKVVSTNSGLGYVVEYTDNYAYDGWNCVAVLNSSLSLVNSFLWGTDLSGSMQGAGGVGGLVQVTYYGSSPTNGFVAYDGNGNVVALVNAADGSTLSLYEYGPFGELLRATGPLAKLNPFRFSTKYDDDESDFLYYGYRYYNPSTGRWLSRDPAEENEGGPNLYALVGNDSIQSSDPLGLATYQAANSIWTGANLWQAQVWSSCGCHFGLVNIGTISIPLAWIDASPTSSLATAAPAVWSWIAANYHLSQRAVKMLTNPSYVGAGTAFQFTPGVLAEDCCGEISWEQDISRWWGWAQDGRIVQGNLFLDSPGGLSWQFPWTHGAEFRLHLRCDGNTIYTLNWSYSVSPSGGYKVTLNLP